MATAATATTKGRPAKKPVKKEHLHGHRPHPIDLQQNTIVNHHGRERAVISWASAGSRGFKGSRKSTPFAAQLAAEEASRRAQEHGLRSVAVFVKGPGAGRESALRALNKQASKVTLIRDVTPIPHNGCRPPKRRRV